MATLSSSISMPMNPQTHFLSGSSLKPVDKCFLKISSTEQFPCSSVRAKASRNLSVIVRARDDGSTSNGSIFVGGFVLGSLIVGALGCIYAPKISEALAGADSKELMRKLPKFIFDEEKALENKEAAVAAQEAGRPMEEIIVLRERCIKAFLLFLVCCTIFSSKSQNYVDVVYLQYFENLQVHNWNWGADALVYLQGYMEQASKMRCGQMAGYMSFLQGWVISHFPRLSVWRVDENYNETLPHCANFVPGQ